MILDRLHPALVAILGIGILTSMDALLKHLGPNFHTFQLVFLRFLLGIMATTAVWLYLRPPLPSRQAVKINVLRGVIGAVTATTFFYGVQTLPLAEAIAFSFLSPLFLALFGALLLKEIVGRYTMIALGVGFLGMLVMVFGQGVSGTTLHMPGVLAVITSAVCYAFGLVLLRQRARADALITIVFFQTLVPATIMATPAFMVWKPVTLAQVGVFALIGMLGVAGHLLLGMAFRRAEASRLAVAEYSALIYATLLGFVFFDEVPGLATLAGTVLIVIGTVLAMRERASPAEPPLDPAP
jgi:drug/metabolite transporter (DMT)-like permease